MVLFLLGISTFGISSFFLIRFLVRKRIFGLKILTAVVALICGIIMMINSTLFYLEPGYVGKVYSFNGTIKELKEGYNFADPFGKIKLWDGAGEEITIK
jgi:hypothetical protein